MAIGVGQHNAFSISQITSGIELPWVKDDPGNGVWSDWYAENRDLYLLDRESIFRYRFNLTSEFNESKIREKVNLLLNE